MVNETLQIAGVLIACIGGLGTIISTFLPDWKKNDPEGDVLESIVTHQGIWIRCKSLSTGHWQCDDYDAFFIGLDRNVQVARGMSICANLFGFIGFLLAIFGFQCTTCMVDNQLVKNRVALASGVFWILSGISIGVAASVFSHDVLTEYHQLSQFGNAFGGTRYIFGSALFIGWAAMVLTLLGGLVVCCGSCGESHPVTKYQERSVRRVRSIGRSVSMSFRRGRPADKHENAEYI